MRIRRATLSVAVAMIAVGLCAIVAGPSFAAPRRPSAHAASAPATIGLRRTKLGMILVNSRGFTVYAFTHDPLKKNTCMSIKGCSSFWPPVSTSGAPRAGRGVRRSLLGTIRIKGGLQVTYAGHALYLYSGDSGPGQTSYVRFNAFQGEWKALRSSGALVGN